MTNDQTPENVIALGRDFYRLNLEEPSGVATDVIIRQVAIGLNLDHPDYDDLVRHLVTADEVDEDAYRWATSGSEQPTARRSTVPEGYGGGWTGQTF